MRIECRFSYYEPSFQLGDAYKFGIQIAKKIHESINGGLACAYADVGLLAQASCRNGDHLELGTLFGATGIAVAATKKEFGMSGDVYTIDNGQYQAKLTRQQNIHFPDDLLTANAELFGVADRIHAIQADTCPLPSLVNNMMFASAFIDAGHEYKDCYADWMSVRKLANIVVFHDYDSSHVGVVDAVRDAQRHNPDWWLVHVSSHTAIMERKKDHHGEKRWRMKLTDEGLEKQI